MDYCQFMMDYYDYIYVLAVVALGFLLMGLLLGRGIPKRATRRARGSGSAHSTKRASRGGSSEIYVGNLPYDMSESDLGRMFRQFGKVLSVRIISHRDSGDSKGFGFIELSQPDQAKAAINGMNSREIEGRRIVVSSARTSPRERRRRRR